MSTSTEKALFCFEFCVEAIEPAPSSVNVQSLEIKFNDYERLTISQEHWENVGKRCYLINEANFLEQMLASKLHVRATCSDRSAYSCDVNLSSFHVTDDAASCKGIMKLYALDESSKNLYIRIIMRVFNVDRVHPVVFRQNILAVDRSTQTERCGTNTAVQANAMLRHAAVQTKHRRVKSKQTQVMERHAATVDAAIQFSSRISKKENQAIAEIMEQILAAKRKKHLQKQPAKKQADLSEKQNQIKSWNVSGKLSERGNFLSKKVQRSRNFTEQNYMNFAGNHPQIGYNVVCRKQLLRTLDRLIAQETATLQRIRMSKSSVNDNTEWKVKRLCRSTATPGTEARKLWKSSNTLTKNKARKSLMNGKQLSQSVQDLSQKSNNKNYSTISGTSSNRSSASTAGNETASGLPRNLTKRSSESEGSNGQNAADNGNSSIVVSHTDNNERISDNNENNNSTARTVSTEQSSEASTVSELESIK